MPQHAIVAAGIDAIEAWDDFANDALVGMSADEGVREGVVKRQLRDQVLHSRVEAVVAGFEAVQRDMRQMVRAEDVGHVRLHRLADALHVKGIELLVALLNVRNSPVLPAVPGEQVVIFPPAHASVKEERSTQEVVAVNDYGRLCIQDMHIGDIRILVAGILQRLLEGTLPEFVVAKSHYNRNVSRKEPPEECLQADDIRRRHVVSRHYNHIGRGVLDHIADVLQEWREAHLANRIGDIVRLLVQVDRQSIFIF